MEYKNSTGIQRASENLKFAMLQDSSRMRKYNPNQYEINQSVIVDRI